MPKTNPMIHRNGKAGPRSAGYTMLELLVVLGIVGVLAVIAAPSFQDSIRRNGRDSAMLDLMSSLALARSEAITQSRVVAICRSTDSAACAASTGSDWDDGWIVFTDSGTKGVVTAGDTLLQVYGPGNDQAKVLLKTRLNGNFTGDYLRFDADGFLENSSTGAWFKFCDQANVQLNARAVLLSNTGRPAMSADQPDGIHHDLAGANLTCP